MQSSGVADSGAVLYNLHSLLPSRAALHSLLPSRVATKESVSHRADAAEQPTRPTRKRHACPDLRPSTRSIDASLRSVIILLAGPTMFDKTGLVLAGRMCILQKLLFL